MLQRYLFAACALVLYTSSKQTSDAFQHPTTTTTVSNNKNNIHVIVTTQPSNNGFGLEQKRRIPFTKLFADNDDDFYADYDPSMYETMNNSFDDDNDVFSSSNNRGGGRGRGGSFGRGGRGGGRNFQYTRDTSRDSSNIDENIIYSLLERRSDAKRERDFDTADQIRDDLLQNYSVGVDDRSRTWRTGCSSSGSGMRFGGGGGRGGGRGRGRPRDFGPNGHDYMLSPDAGPSTTSLSLDEINGLLADRLQAKMSRNFHVADEIQMNLIDSGVFVHDGMKEWRADGIPYGDIGGGRGPGRTRNSRSDRNRAYTKSIHSVDVEGTDDAMIDKLVMERMKFKIQRDYEKADAIREGLRTKFNVLIDDKLREWSVNGDFGEEHNRQREMAEQFAKRDYIKSPSSLSLDEESEGIIQSMVNERCGFKEDRDFDSADAIRDDLKERFDVEIHDRMKLWSIGGDFGVEVKQYPEYEISSSSAPVDDEVKRKVQSALKERSKLKKRRNYGAADAIRDDLRAKYGVMVDDRTREWRVRTDFGNSPIDNSAPSDSAPTFDNFDEDFDDDGFEAEMAKLDADLSREVSEAMDFMSPKSDVETNGTSKDEDGDDEEEISAEMTDEDEEYEYEDEEEEDDEEYEYEYEYEEEDEEEEATLAVQNVESEESDQNIVAESSNAVEMDEDEDTKDDDDEYEYEYYEEEEEEEEEEDGVEDDTMLSADELSSMTVVQLKEKLKENGLPVSGKKSELVDRLLASVE